MRTQNMNRRLLMVAYLAAIGFILFLVNSGIVSGFRDILDVQFPLNDKIAHFLFLGILGFILPYSLLNHSIRLSRRSFVAIQAVLVMAITMEEFSQRYISTRSFQLTDLLADYLGLFCFATLYLLYHKRKSHKGHEEQTEYTG